MMKIKLALPEPRTLVYSNFKSFNKNYFEEELQQISALTTKTTWFLSINFIKKKKKKKIVAIQTTWIQDFDVHHYEAFSFEKQMQ